MSSRYRVYFISAIFAVIVTCLLFSLMYYLTNFGDRRADLSSTTTPVFDFIRVKLQERNVEERERLPEPLATPKKPKIAPPRKRYFQLSPGLERLSVQMPHNLDIQGNFSFSLFGSHNISPLVRVQPIYPLRARSRGIEGWVEVEFTIAEDGSVINPVIVDAEPPRIFDNATLKAVSKWRYQPQVIDNEPVMRSGVRVIIEYQLEG